MASPISGLLNTELATGKTNYRRKIFHKFPTGSAQLMGLLSLTSEEETNSNKFSWFEDSYPDYRTTLANVSTTVVFRATTSPYGVLSADVADFGNDDLVCINVASRDYIRLGSVLRFNVLSTTPSTVEVCITVTELPTSVSTAVIGRVHGLAADITLDFNGAHAGNVVYLDSDAKAEKHTSAGDGSFREPIDIYNYIQCIETSYSLTAAAKVSTQEYDGKGVAPEKMWQNALRHGVSIENMLFFGKRHKYADTSDNSNPTLHSGGIEWFLNQYEAANSTYRGGSGASALSSDDDELKRIITNSAGTLTVDKMEEWMRRIFQFSNNQTNSKIAFMGSKVLTQINKLYRDSVTYNRDSNDGELQKFGVNYKGMETPFGELWFKTHPLFAWDPTLQKSMYILDLGLLKMRYLSGLNTQFIEHAENPADSFQKSIWRSYLGLELHDPQGFMIVRNIETAQA